MAVEIASAYVSLIPSAKGLGRGIGAQLGRSVADDASAAFSSRFSSRLQRTTAGIATFGKRVGVAFGTGFAFLAGATLKTGYDRLTQIQDATSSLTVILGSASKAGALVTAVLKTIQGTPFSLPQFATVARNLAAFGVDAKKIPGILTAIGDAAAASGKGAAGVQQITDAVGEMAASGQVSLDQVWRISDSGVNALAILANGFGVTTVEMKKMISKGSVPAGKAIDILTKGIEDGSDGVAGKTIALAGIAKKLGDTASGAFANMKTGLARFGATILGPIFTRLPGIFDGITGSLDGLAHRVTIFELQFVAGFRGVGDSIAGSLGKGLKAVVDFFKKNPDARFAALAGIIGGALLIAVITIGSALAALLSPAVLLVAGFALLTAGVVYAYKHFEGFRDLVDGIVRWLVGTAWPAIQSFAEILDKFVQKMGGWGKVLKIAGIAIALIVAPLATVAAAVIYAYTHFEGFRKVVQTVVDAVVAKFSQLVAWVKTYWPQIREAIGHVAVAIRDIIGAIVVVVVKLWHQFGDRILTYTKLAWNSLYRVIKIGVDLIAGIIRVVTAVINGDWGKAWDAIKETFGRVWSGLVGILRNSWDIILNVFGAALEALGGLIEKGLGVAVEFFRSLAGRIASALGNLVTVLIPKGLELLGGFLAGLVQKLPFLIGFMLALPIVLTTRLGALANRLVPKALSFLGGFLLGLAQKLPALALFMVTLPGKLEAKLIGLAAKLIPKGIQLLTGFLTGMVRRIPDLLHWVTGIPGRIIHNLGDLGSKLLGAGKELIRGLWNGIKSMDKWLADKVKGFAGGVVKGFTSALHIGSPSKLMAEMVGKPIAQGIGVGMAKNMPSVTPFVSHLVGGGLGAMPSPASRGFRPAFSPGMPDPAGANRGAAPFIGHADFHDGVDLDLVKQKFGYERARGRM